MKKLLIAKRIAFMAMTIIVIVAAIAIGILCIRDYLFYDPSVTSFPKYSGVIISLIYFIPALIIAAAVYLLISYFLKRK
ncbi:hypothetical protein LJC63_02575 [Ruminococcaceae bacterium OttesenSCG-928-L11]|nr:hypothetical protein [Ruminococcaceae bacterium OttesenSCG-928-L11]